MRGNEGLFEVSSLSSAPVVPKQRLGPWHHLLLILCHRMANLCSHANTLRTEKLRLKLRLGQNIPGQAYHRESLLDSCMQGTSCKQAGSASSIVKSFTQMELQRLPKELMQYLLARGM